MLLRSLLRRYNRRPKRKDAAPEQALTDGISQVSVAMPLVDDIRTTAHAFWPSRALTAAVEMGLFTELSSRDSGMTHPEIVHLLCLHENLSADFLDVLVSVDMLHRDGDGALAVYSNTPATALYLVKSRADTYIGDTLVTWGTRSYAQWGANYTKSLRAEANGTLCPMVKEMIKQNHAILRRYQTCDTVQVSPGEILHVALGFVRSRVLCAAVDLDLFATVHKHGKNSNSSGGGGYGQMTALQLRQMLRLTCSMERMVDFLDALVSWNLLQAETVGSKKLYSNTPATKHFLIRPTIVAESEYYGALVVLASVRVYHLWNDLPDALTTGMNQNETIRVKMFEELHKVAGDDLYDMFMNGLVSLSAECRKAFVESFDLSKYRTLVDLGGGSGHLAWAAALHNPTLMSCTPTDLPPMERLALQCMDEEFGMKDDQRVQFLVHNFLTDDIPSADVIVLCWVLHIFSLPVKKQLLKKILTALPDDGVLVIMDPMIDNERRSNTYGLGMSLHMLIEFGVEGGSQYTGADVTSWCLEVGFGRVEVQPVGSSLSMALAYKK